MMYYLGQGMGLLATVCCVVLPLFRKKWHMLAASALSNVFFALNLLLIGQISSAIIVNTLIVIQSILSMWHVKKDKPVTTGENIIFLAAFIVCGALGFKSALDLLPIAGAVFSMLSIFQRDEQKTRFLVCINAICFFTYYVVIGSTSMLAELCAIVTTIAGMIKYAKRR